MLRRVKRLRSDYLRGSCLGVGVKTCLSPPHFWSLYDRLGISRHSTVEEIECAYFTKLASIPEAGFSGWLSSVFQLRFQYDEAFSVLGDLGKRQSYDDNPSGYQSARLPPFFC